MHLVCTLLKHAFREVTFGFCKGTVPGAPPLPSPGPPRMPKSNSKETYLVPPQGHISVKNMWSDSQVVQRYRTRGAPFSLHKALGMPKRLQKKKTCLVQGPKARLCQGTFEKPRLTEACASLHANFGELWRTLANPQQYHLSQDYYITAPYVLDN